jgi:hypothetical protein
MRFVKYFAVLILLVTMIMAITGCKEKDVIEDDDRRIIAVSIVPQKT